MEKLDKVIAGLTECYYGKCTKCPYMFSGDMSCNDAVNRDALELLKEYRNLKKLLSGANVRPDWYERLTYLDYDYNPVADKDPWYRAEDVWACIEEESE